MNKIVLDSEQEQGVADCASWFRTVSENPAALREKPYYTILGFAGTGKTTLTGELIKFLGLDPRENARNANAVQPLTFMGKASLILSQRLPFESRTIHSFAYRSGDRGWQFIQSSKPSPYYKPVTPVYRDRFSQLEGVKLLLLDEISMVYTTMFQDLLSYNIPILCLGDPGQLPPVTNNPQEYLINQLQTDVFLTKIHRQSENSPILVAATMARNGDAIPHTDDFRVAGSLPDTPVTAAHDFMKEPDLTPVRPEPTSTARKVKLADLTWDELLAADIILCSSNSRRLQVNELIRGAKFQGRTPPILPTAGEKVIVNRNNYHHSLMNGYVLQTTSDANLNVAADGSAIHSTLTIDLIDPDQQLHFDRVSALAIPFLLKFDAANIEAAAERAGNEGFREMALLPVGQYAFPIQPLPYQKPLNQFPPSFPKFAMKRTLILDYAYAITTHRSQGSQWNNVIFIDDFDPQDQRTYAKQLRYTAITRAVSKLTIATP